MSIVFLVANDSRPAVVSPNKPGRYLVGAARWTAVSPNRSGAFLVLVLVFGQVRGAGYLQHQTPRGPKRSKKKETNKKNQERKETPSGAEPM